jgi:UDP-GlcNAc:undecaprenyl-phosphate GlcNAc-1-phosphate transferase
VAGSLIPSMLIAWAAGFAVRRFGPRLGLVDRPGHRKVHAKPTPTSGGLAVWLGIVVPLALGNAVLAILLAAPGGAGAWGLDPPAFIAPHLTGLAGQSAKLWIVLAGGTALMGLGLVDDRRGLDWRLRLGVQTLVALAIVLFEPRFRMTVFLETPWLTTALSVMWIVGLVNAFNMLDNMDGLSAGVASIAAAILAAVTLLVPNPAQHPPQLFVGGFLLVMLGALLGFLWHNRPTARLFMGDAGSYLIGYLLAIATLTATFAGHDVPRHAILAPLCVLAVPLYDATTVIFIRLRQGRSPFVGDKSHFSHRLVELGMTKTQAVLTIYLATATCGLGAFLLHEVDTAGACVVLLLVVCTLVLVAILETTGRSRRSPTDDKDPEHGSK